MVNCCNGNKRRALCCQAWLSLALFWLAALLVLLGGYLPAAGRLEWPATRCTVESIDCDGCGCAYFGFNDTREALDGRRLWQASAQRRLRSRSHCRAEYEADVSYTVDGEQRDAGFREECKESHGAAGCALDDWAVGMNTTCFYDPAHPEHVVRDKSLSPVYLVLIACFVSAGALLGLLCCCLSRRQDSYDGMADGIVMATPL
eukprot:PLAT6003.1.p2 GENE.PLAT6003.1~~PLAT6003.1.p2  ORF type:complete len:203 (+),score=44.40 PLAT6003.1:367-975(+)